MRKGIYTIFQAFTIGCTIFMLSLGFRFIQHGQKVFESITYQYGHVLLGIFIIAVVTGGGGYLMYQTNIPYLYQALLHFSTTIVSIMLVSLWLNFVSISISDFLIYFASTSIIFWGIWTFYYLKLLQESKEINEALSIKNK